jgi:hypothetical protein
VVLANLTARESLRILYMLMGRFEGIDLDPSRNMLLFEAVHFGEFWLDAALAVLLARAAGMVVARLERRKGWDIAAFWRGALLGLLAACMIAAIDDFILRKGQPLQGTFSIATRLALLASSMTVGGVLGRSRLRSRGFSEPLASTQSPSPAQSAR